MEKLRKVLLLINIFTIIAYGLLSFFSINSYAVSQTISLDINGINAGIYPGIKEKINALKAKYPNWKFKILYTNLDWNEVILNEYVGHNAGPRNMIQATGNYQGAWICPVCKYKNESWRCASQDAIKYIMDPRNSLNETDIFQFEELTNNGYDINVINNMINGTFLQGQGNVIANSANATGINPYYIIARLIQEQTRKGTVLSNGSKGYYNPFNIQATGNTDVEVITNGINYAKSQGWNTLEKGITGGINFLSSEYTKKGQNTLYLQKFDVESSSNGLYWHQYMQNLLASQSEGNTLRKTYEGINAISSSHTFVIPVYKNMPSVACSRPDGNSSAIVSGDIVIVNVTDALNLRNAPNGTVIGTLYKNEIVTRIEKATARNGKTYWDKVKKSDGTVGYVARETDVDEAKYKLYLVPVNGGSSSGSSNSTLKEVSTKNIKVTNSNKEITVIPNVTVQDIINAVGNVSVKNINGNNITGNTKVGTGSKVNNVYTVIKKGDVNGDGIIDISDILSLQKHLLGVNNLLQTSKGAGADVVSDGKLDLSDLLKIQKYLLGVTTINI